MPIRDAEKRREYHRCYMKKRRASSAGKVKPSAKKEVRPESGVQVPPHEKQAPQQRQALFNLSAPASEMFKALGFFEMGRNEAFLKDVTALEAIGKAVSTIFYEAMDAMEACEIYPCKDFSGDLLYCHLCQNAGFGLMIEELEKRMDDSSWLVRHALGHNEIKIRCPSCNRWTFLELDEERKLWVCKDCRKKPF